jgi:8-oxo-dGTP pyrophosphatase MutT (NUDIX family)
MKKWQQQSSAIVHQDKWLCLRADTCRMGNGTVIAPYYVLEEADWVHVVAIDAFERVLVTRQYRYAADSFCRELPCGCVEPGESPLAAAKRELQEETGVVAQNWQHVLSPFANPARQTNAIHIFLATDLTSTKELNLDATEEIEHEFLSIEAVMSEIRAGSFSQALHIASLLVSLPVR